MNKKNGFTLVELLAVIVILAVILVIAVPQIINVINESRKGALESSAKLIASAAESAMIANQALGISEEISCEDVSNYNQEDYECKIKVLGNKPYVSLIGKGKFAGQSICYASKEGGVKVQGSVCPPLALEKIESLATGSNTEGLEEDDFGNIRYTGASPKNYIKFNGEDWRIIGLFEVKTASGSTEKLMKIVRNESIGSYSWDSSKGDNDHTHEEGEVNDGWGVSQWGASTYTDGSAYEGADLMRELNDLYLIQGSGDCFNGANDAKTNCDFSSIGINETYRSWVENVVWNTGAISWEQSAKTAYEKERGTTTGKICTSGALCTDEVARTTTWEGKVGLIYPSDFVFASTNKNCRVNIHNSICKNDNWLYTGNPQWTLSPSAGLYGSHIVWHANPDGYLSDCSGRDHHTTRPSVYLKSNVSIISGEGTEQNPYKLSVN